MQWIRKKLEETDGLSTVEYSLLLTLVTITAITAWKTLGTNVSSTVQQTTQQAEMSRSELQRAGFSEVRVFAQDPNSPGVTVALWRDPSGKQYVFRFRIDIRYGEYGPFNPGKKIAYDVDKDTITVDGVAVTGN